ncbi:rDNA transcriptional regulator pol5 [Typha latifolia]|uniref:rDNA transcriptional regulator pol5 n=1 Tax=Typha latifolia TaxID=4733 RepID=UPI003C2CA5CA
MAGKKRPSSSLEELDVSSPKSAEESGQGDNSDAKVKSMEKKKMRKALDKERHRLALETKEQSKGKKPEEPIAVAAQMSAVPSLTASNLPSLHVNLFGDLASMDSSVREAAAEQLVDELREVQKAYEESGGKGADEAAGEARLEAEQNDGLENCAASLRYAIRRLIRGVSSSRECARQGFALGLTLVVGAIPAIKVDSLMKLIVDLLEVSSSMKGQEVKDNLLGRLFSYGSLARSGRIATEWILDDKTSIVKDFMSVVISLAGKKRYLSEPATSIILDMVEKLPGEAILTEVIKAPGMHQWMDKAAEVGDPDALLLALKLQERLNVDIELFRKLLPHPFSSDNFFTRDHLSCILPCFKESTFCLPRLHSIWPLVVNILVPEMASQEDAAVCSSSSKKHKRSKKGSSSEDIANNLRSFFEVVIEGSLLLSSHDRKHLALNVLLILLPRLPESCIQIVLSNKIIHCLMDILSNETSWLYNAGQHFLKELVNLVSDNDDRRVAAIVSLQKYSNGRFDSTTQTRTVKQLVAKFSSAPGCILFVHNLMSLFVDEGPVTDEPSDQSQTTDENSEVGSTEDRDPQAQGNSDFLKNWVIDTMPRVLKNLKLDSSLKSLSDTDTEKFVKEKFRVQAEIMKFLAVQGLFSASLGTEVTSFELQEKFKWPKAAISSSLRSMCIEQLQLLLEDAQRGESPHVINDPELNDLGSYFMCFLNTLCNIPSVSLYRTLSNEDEKAFKKLQAMESTLSREETKDKAGVDATKIHALRYLLIQLLLQVLLRPGEFSEASIEIVICCKKAFPSAAHGDSSEEEDEFDENGTPEFMNVLVDTLLSLLPQSSGPTCFAVEQVFRFFCDEITDAGLLQMLRIVKKDLKPHRHQTIGSGSDEDDEEDDFLGIEESEENDVIDPAETGDSDDHGDDFEGKSGAEVVDEEVNKNDEDNSEEMVGVDATDPELTEKDEELPVSDESDDMDDDAMFRIDPYIARVFKERKISTNDGVQSQLMPFKFRVLALLEIFLQKNPGKTQVLTVYSYLMQAFIKSHTGDGGEQLRQRIGGILQKKIFKAKDYPKGTEVEISSLETLLEKCLKSASRSRFKTISSVAQNSTFWILKIINSRNFSEPQLEGAVDIFRNILVDYFNNKKSRLKLGFVKEVIRRHPWIARQLFGFLLEKCGSAKSEFRRIETLDLVECILKSWVPRSKGELDKDVSGSSKLLKKHLKALCELIRELLSKLPEKQSRRAEVRRFCTRVLDTISVLDLKKSFLKALTPDACLLCQSQLGTAFTPFKALNQ